MAPRRSIATLMAWLLLVSLAVIGIPNASEAPAAAQPGIVHLPDTSSIDVKTGELATVGTLALVAEPQPDQPRGLAAPTDSPATDALLPVEDAIPRFSSNARNRTHSSVHSLGLRWSDIDLEAGRISIQQTRLSVAYEVVLSEPKTAKGRRSVALDAGTVAELRDHRIRQLEERLAAGQLWHNSDATFTDELGRPIHPDRFTKLFVSLVESAGIERLTPHGLRHTHATVALQANRNPKVVSERLGHASVSITLDTYSHVTPAMEQDLADTVARIVDDSSG